MKIETVRLDLSSGKLVSQKQKPKVSNFSEGDAATFFKKYLFESGYEDYIGSTTIDKKRYGKLLYPTLFDKPIKCHFVLWQAKQDTETGKAVFWVGERNVKNYEQVDYGVIIGDRIIPTDVYWHCLIVAPRKYRIGRTTKDLDFVEYLLMPLKDIVEEIQITKTPYIDIRQSHREKYAFKNMLERLKEEDFQTFEYTKDLM